ncbi:MAG: hypothetical protein PHU85_04165 [Phycisphaerae bacterium]|nr:hypothetical protein [Phycisphaerae bacterium]
MFTLVLSACCCLMVMAAVSEAQPAAAQPAAAQPAAAQPAAAQPAAAQPTADTFVENRFIRVGVNLMWGGAVTHVSTPGGPNIINSADLGRQVQQSYYSGPANYQREGKQKSPAWAGFPWNPIQTGDAYRNGSKVLEHRVRGDELYVKTVPMLWPMNNDPGECVMETWITLQPDGSKFAYRARLTNARSDKTQYHGSVQEVPAIYVNGPWHRLMAYVGDKPFTGGPVSEIRNDHREAWPWVNALPTEGWAALMNEQGTGIGVIVPRPMEFHGGFSGPRGQGGEKDRPTGYMSPITTEILDHNIVYDYACTFVVGSLDDVRAEAKRRAPKDPPAWDLENARQGWYYSNGSDAGWPLAGRGLAIKADTAGQPVRIIGPHTFWRAESAGQLRIRITAATAGTVRVYWRGVPPPVASAKPSEWAKWRQVWWEEARSAEAKIPAGAKQWVAVNLAGRPGYKGGLTGLALDVPDGSAVHEVRLVGVK